MIVTEKLARDVDHSNSVRLAVTRLDDLAAQGLFVVADAIRAATANIREAVEAETRRLEQRDT